MWQVMLWDNERRQSCPVFRTREEAEKAFEWYSSLPIYTEDSISIEPVYIYDKFESIFTELKDIYINNQT